MSHVKMGTMYVNQLMCTCTIFCHMGKMSDGPVKVGENDCWAQCHMGTMSRFGVIWAQCHLALPIWHPIKGREEGISTVIRNVFCFT